MNFPSIFKYGESLLPLLSKTIISLIPSRFKSISENCEEFIPPFQAFSRIIEFWIILTLVSLEKLIWDVAKLIWNINKKNVIIIYFIVDFVSVTKERILILKSI